MAQRGIETPYTYMARRAFFIDSILCRPTIFSLCGWAYPSSFFFPLDFIWSLVFLTFWSHLSLASTTISSLSIFISSFLIFNSFSSLSSLCSFRHSFWYRILSCILLNFSAASSSSLNSSALLSSELHLVVLSYFSSSMFLPSSD